MGKPFAHPVCFQCLPDHRPSCEQWLYLETQAQWYSWELERSPYAFDLPNAPDPQHWRILYAAEAAFADRFGSIIPECHCGRYRSLRPDDTARRFQKGLLCGLCAKNGAVRTWSGREIRAVLAPRLFAAGQMIHELRGGLTIDAHHGCIVKLGARVTEELFVETVRLAAGA